MSILPTWPMAAAALVVGLALGTYADRTIMNGRIAKIEKTHADVLNQIAQVQAQDEKDNRAKEKRWQAQVGQIEQENIDEQNRIAVRYAAELDRLRQRPDRRPAPVSGMPQAAPACEAATGAELSRSDAGFLAGLAARADQQRATLAACYSAYDAVSDLPGTTTK